MKISISPSKILENKSKISEELKGLETAFQELKSEMNQISSSDIQYTKEFVRIYEEYQGISQEILEFSKSLLDHVEKEIKVGIVGHFSHGKSTLINSFLHKSDDDMREILPTGDGICTSVPTVIRFDDGTDIRYEMNDKNLSSEDFHAAVTSIDDNTKVPHGIKISYGVREQSVLEPFQKNNILLVDTPGMGGPYFSDNILIKRWMEQFSLVLLIISAKDINQVSANQVKGFLRNYTKHMLIFVTMWDEWKNCTDYKECKNNESAQDKALDMITREFEDVSQAFVKDELLLKTVFVSAKNYLDPKMRSVPKSERFDESWGRNVAIAMILNYISNKKDVVEGKMVLSPLIEEKLMASKRVFEKLEFSKKQLHDFSKSIRSKTKKNENQIDTNDIKDIQRKTEEEFEKYIKECSKKISREVKSYANDMLRYETTDYGSFNSKVKGIYEKQLEQLEKKIKKSLEKSSKHINHHIEKQLEERSDFDFSLIEELDNIIDALENIRMDMVPDEFSVDYSSFTAAENLKKAFVRVFKHKEIEKNKRESFKLVKNRYVNDVNSESRIIEQIDDFLDHKDEIKECFERLVERINEDINEKNQDATEKLESCVEEIEFRIENVLDWVKE
ncbi:MAG TPA: dynamin family protein [Thermotogota bacterium]|nr:dynamin family protein [Thermotogota bacterium]